MGFNIGPTITVQGEAAYNAAMKNVKASMGLVSSEARIMSAQFQGNENSVQALTAKGKTLNDALKVQKQAVKEAEDALQRMKDAGVDPSSQSYVAMETNLNNAKAALIGTENEIKKNEEAMKSGGRETGAFTQHLKSFAETAGKVALGAAKAFAIGIGAVATAAAFAAKKIFDLTVNSGKWADDLLTMSKQTDVSVQTLQELEYAGRFVDVTLTDMTKGMGRVVASMREATGKGKDYIEVAGGIKIAMKDSNGQMKSTQQMFYDTVDALGDIEDATLRDIAAQDIFGKSYQDIKPLIDAGSEALLKYAAEAHAAGLILSDEAVNALGSFDDQMERTNARLQTAGRLAAVTFLPAVSSIVAGVTDILSTITTALSDGFQEGDIQTISDAISKQIKAAIEGVAQNAPAFIGVITNVLSTVVGMIVEIIPTLLPVLATATVQLMTGMFQVIQQNAQPISDAVVQLVVMFVTFLADNLPMIIETGLTILLAITQGILANIPAIIPAVVEMITGIALAITNPDILAQLVVASFQITIAVIQGLMDSLPQLLSAAMQVIINLVIAFGEAAPQLWESGKEFILQLDEGIQAKMAEIRLVIGEWIGTNIIQPIKDKVTEFLEIGKNMVMGLWNGINDKMQWIKDKISGWVKNVLQFFKDLLGIKSPSTEFYAMGDMSGEGYANGIWGSLGKVQNVIAKMKAITVNGLGGGIKAALDAVTGSIGSVGITANVSGATTTQAAGAVNNYNIQIYANDQDTATTLADKTVAMLQTARWAPT